MWGQPVLGYWGWTIDNLSEVTLEAHTKHFSAFHFPEVHQSFLFDVGSFWLIFVHCKIRLHRFLCPRKSSALLSLLLSIQLSKKIL